MLMSVFFVASSAFSFFGVTDAYIKCLIFVLLSLILVYWKLIRLIFYLLDFFVCCLKMLFDFGLLWMMVCSVVSFSLSCRNASSAFGYFENGCVFVFI